MHVWTLLQHTMIVVYVLRRTAVYKVYVTPLLLSSVLFVNKVLKLFTCNNGFEKGTGANENEHTCEYVIWFKIKIFWHPAVADSRKQAFRSPEHVGNEYKSYLC